MAAILLATSQHPSASIPHAAGDSGQTKGAYCFDGNPRVTPAALHLGIAADTARRCLEQDVLLVVHHPNAINKLRATLVIPYRSSTRPYAPRLPRRS